MWIVEKGPAKLIGWAEIALLFLHITSKPFQFTIFKLASVVLHPSAKEFFTTIY